jgi:hypothetical protein
LAPAYLVEVGELQLIQEDFLGLLRPESELAHPVPSDHYQHFLLQLARYLHQEHRLM